MQRALGVLTEEFRVNNASLELLRLAQNVPDAFIGGGETLGLRQVPERQYGLNARDDFRQRGSLAYYRFDYVPRKDGGQAVPIPFVYEVLDVPCDGFRQ